MANETLFHNITSDIDDIVEKSKGIDPKLLDRYLQNRAIDEPAYTRLIAMYSILIILGALGNTLVFAMACGKIRKVLEKRQKLIGYLQANNLNRISAVVHRDPDVINITFGQPFNGKTLLQIACCDENGMENVSGTTIEKLLEMGADPTLLSKKDHWEVLHYASVNAKKEKLAALLKRLRPVHLLSLVHCSEHLKKRYPWTEIKDIPESYCNNALHVLLKYGNPAKDLKDCVELLIQSGVDVDQKDSNGVTPRNLIKNFEDDHLNFLLENSNEVQSVGRNSSSFDCLRSNDEESFLNLDFRQVIVDGFDGVDNIASSCTLLQLACVKNLEKCVKLLLNKGANPNKIVAKNRTLPIMLAIKHDHQKIVELLLMNEKIALPVNILIKIQTNYRKLGSKKIADKYMAIILRYIRSHPKGSSEILNATDDLNKTALHYATYYGCPESITLLLSMGASLTKRDFLGFTPLNYIEPDLFEKFLDSCIEMPNADEDLTNVLYSIRDEKKNFSLEINYKNLVQQDDGTALESEFLQQLVKTKNLKPYLNHPVTWSYLEIKWQKFKWFYFTSLLLYCIAYFALLFYGFAFYRYQEASNTFLLVALLLLFFREFAQIFIFRLTRLETYVDLLLIAGIIYILAAGWYEELVNRNLLVAFSVVFLLSTFGIFLQLENFPMFTIKVIILRRITYNFSKYIVFYLFPILAFAFCFYMLTDNKDDTWLIPRKIYETFVMFSGDINGDYPESFETNPIFGHFIYVMFALFIGVILQNLLVGLAVSDMQEVQKEAEFIEKIERSEYIMKIEKVILDMVQRADVSLVKRMFKGLLRMVSVFHHNPVLVIQPYNSGCVYTKDNQDDRFYINDSGLINNLQEIFKNFHLEDETYTLKSLHEKVENLENVLKEISKRLSIQDLT